MVAANQLKAKRRVLAYLGRGAVGIGGEAITEAAQEATAYTAAVYGSNKEWNWEELSERLTAAAIAGGTLGGVFTVPGTFSDGRQWKDIAVKGSLETGDNASTGQIYADEEKAKYGEVASIQQLNEETRDRAVADPNNFVDFNTRVESGAEARKSRPTADRLKDDALNVSQLWQGITRNIFTEERQQRSRSMRILADMFDGRHSRIFSGASLERTKFHTIAKYKNMIVDPKKFWSTMNGFKALPFRAASRKAEISQETYAALNAATNTDGDFDPNLVPENAPNRQAIIELGKQAIALGEKMHADQAKYNPELGKVKNYLFKYKGLNKKAVHDNRAGFAAALRKEYKYTPAEADELVNKILDSNEIHDIGDALDQTSFSVTRGGISPSSHKKRNLGMSENEAFQGFMEQDIFANFATASKSAARYNAHQQFLGDNGSNIARLLQDARNDGLSESEVNEVARRLQDYLDAESGNYKRPTSPQGKAFQRITEELHDLRHDGCVAIGDY